MDECIAERLQSALCGRYDRACVPLYRPRRNAYGEPDTDADAIGSLCGYLLHRKHERQPKIDLPGRLESTVLQKMLAISKETRPRGGDFFCVGTDRFTISAIIPLTDTLFILELEVMPRED